MKTLMSLVVLSAGLIAVSAQDVFVLGGPGSYPVPPIVYQPPIVNGGQTYQAVQPVIAAIPVQPVMAAIPVTPVYATPAYATPYHSGYSGYNYIPNVIYIGGPGTCGPNYYDYGRCSTPNVIYFGREQAYRQGYNFRHCR